MTSLAPPGLATTVADTPNGRLNMGVVVWPEGNPNTTGPSKPATHRRTTSRAVTRPPGSSQRGN